MNQAMTNDEVRTAVRETYGKVARAEVSGCCAPSCCGGAATTPSATQTTTVGTPSALLGYSADELRAVPEGADLGLGCGNPQAIAALRPGETVLDLGAGGGFDALLAARAVGPSGRVIGVDMTPEMVSRARANAAKAEARNVEFRLGEIEQLPVGDGTVDAIISNCVINLSPDKARVFAEAFRVLRPGGRVAISDIVALQPLPAGMAADVAAITGCVAQAASPARLEALLVEAGFEAVRVQVKPESRSFIRTWFPGSGAEDYVASASIEARRPEAERAHAG